MAVFWASMVCRAVAVATQVLGVALQPLPGAVTAQGHQRPHQQGVDGAGAAPFMRAVECQGQHRNEKTHRYHPGAARGRVREVLQSASEEPQPDREQGAQYQGAQQPAVLFLRVVAEPMLHGSTDHKQHYADGGGPQGALAAEKAVVDGAGDEADAAVLEQHRAVVVLKSKGHDRSCASAGRECK